MKRKTSQGGSKRQVSPLEETKDAKKPKLKILSLVNSPKYGKPMRNYIPQTKNVKNLSGESRQTTGIAEKRQRFLLYF